MPGFRCLPVLLLLAGLAWSTPQAPLKPAEWKQLGFHVTHPFQSVKPTAWESDKLQVTAKGRMKVKGRFPSPLGKGHRYRFTIDVEEYQDSAQASFRLQNLFVKPPKLGAEERKAFPLQRGFRSGNTVIIVHTDAAAFLDKVEALRDALMHAGLSQNPKARATLLDSLGRAFRAPKR